MGRFDSVGVRLAVATSLPFVLVALGTLGYQWIEGWSWFDALYMTVITLGTVGFGETHELSQPGRAFTIVLILGGAFTMAAAVTSVIRALISGDLRQLLGRQRMERTLAHFENHVIVVGFGRMGSSSARSSRRRASHLSLSTATAKRCGASTPRSALRYRGWHHR